MSEVTQIIDRVCAGDPTAAEELMPVVYDQLRKLAAAKMAAESPDHTLSATALVHEAYLRLVGDQHFEGRAHFFAAAAEAMRRILVENARRKQSFKHGGDHQRHSLEGNDIAAPEVSGELLALDDALNELAIADPMVAELVKLRYFAGLTIPQAAAQLGISPRSADSWWAYAKAWFQASLQERQSES